MLASGFSAKAMQVQEELLSGYVDLFISELKKLALRGGDDDI